MAKYITNISVQRITLPAGDIIEIMYDLTQMLAIVAAAAISNDSGRAIAQGGLLKAKVLRRVTESRKMRRARKKAEHQTASARADFVYWWTGMHRTLVPQSEAAKVWADEHLPADAPRVGAGYFITTNYFGAIEEGILSAGFSLMNNDR